MTNAKQQKELDRLLQQLQQALGQNLRSLVLYGSAAGENFSEGVSDLNLLAIVNTLDAGTLEALRAPLADFVSQQPVPLFFTHEELKRSADVFAVELLDMQVRHKVLYGEDLITGITVPMQMHRRQVEHELRAKSLRLRQHYIGASDKPALIVELVAKSSASFVTLFRHALIALGNGAPATPGAAPMRERLLLSRSEVVDELQRHTGIDLAGFRKALALRDNKPEWNDAKSDARKARALFAGYLESIEKVTQAVDGLLE